ncbi:helix-turn-helix domain-containing protein [Bacillus pinisoli]|uniref:helix-turn-helix domain-containing protein n=1 Tax=Bacillus pinisoli TaxID=2901866 RepID=UPI001FF3E69C|nr:helix-turn-helix transcriptional regulator [Bacillus pinisoli]
MIKDDTKQTLPTMLRQLRGKESLRNASTRIGISHNYLSNLEKGIDPRTDKPIHPSPDILKKISKAYSFPYEELMVIAGYTESESTGDKIDLLEYLNSFNGFTWGGREISSTNQKKIITIINTMLLTENE